MLTQTQAGLQLARQAAGVAATQPGGIFGELLNTRLLPDYYALTKGGYTFSLGGVAANPTAFTGGAAGTPLLGLYNPLTSGVDMVLLEVALAIRTTGTAAVAYDLNHWASAAQGATAPTGTQTQARGLYTLLQSGSVAYGMVNTANTGGVATNLIRPSASGGLTAATAAPNAAVLRDEIKGEIIIPPGGYYAFGSSGGLTAASLDFAAIWAEVPV